MIPMSTSRIAGSVLCCWGWSRDPGNPACENVALPGFDLCPAHEKISKYLEAVATQSPDNFDEADDYLHGQWEPRSCPDCEEFPCHPECLSGGGLR